MFCRGKGSRKSHAPESQGRGDKGITFESIYKLKSWGKTFSTFRQDTGCCTSGVGDLLRKSWVCYWACRTVCLGDSSWSKAIKSGWSTLFLKHVAGRTQPMVSIPTKYVYTVTNVVFGCIVFHGVGSVWICYVPRCRDFTDVKYFEMWECPGQCGWAQCDLRGFY